MIGGNVKVIKIRKEEKILCEIVNNLVEGKLCMENVSLDSEIDWNYFYDICKKNKVQYWVMNHIKEYLPLKTRLHYENEQQKFVKKMDAYMGELKYLTSISRKMNIPILCVKGFPLAYHLYGNIYTRPFHDLDIIVPKQYILSFRDKLLENHVQMNKGVYSKDDYLDFIGIFHEFWLKRRVEEQEVFIEIKETSSAIERRFVDDFIDNSTVIKINDVEFRTTDLIHSFLHLCSNTFENYETMNGVLRHIKMRDLIDVKLFLRKNIDKMDWKKIVELSGEYEITHRIFCVLHYVNDLFEEKIPESIIMMFSTSSINYEVSYCNTIGGKIAWNDSVVERMFMDYEQKRKIYLGLVYDRELSKMNNKKYIRYNGENKRLDNNWSKLEVPGIPSLVMKWNLVEVNHKLAVDLLLSPALINAPQFFYQMIFFISEEIKTIWIRRTDEGYKYGYRNDTDDREISFVKDSETYIFQDDLVVRSYLDEEGGFFYQSSCKGIGCNVLIHVQQGKCSLPIVVKYSDKGNPEEYLDNVEVWKKREK